MLTILIRENVISDQISTISSEMMKHGIIQIIITMAVMLAVFLGLICHSKRSAGILLKQEREDGARIRAAYAQIEREQTDMENIHNAMGSGRWNMEFNEKAEMVSCIWTDTFRRMLGYESEEEFPNRLESWSDLLHADDKEWVVKEYWDTVRDYSDKKTYNVEYRLLTKHAGWRWFHAAGRLSRREDGSPLTFVGLFVDIDDEKKMKVRLEQQKADLQDALAAAQHANKAKTTFLNNMSHDIRTPMNAIIGFTSLAAAHIDNTEQVQDYLSKITTSSNHLLSLINDVLDMSKIESGKMTLNIAPISLREVMDSIVNIVQPQVKAKNLQFDTVVHDILAENVRCDSVRLNQVLINLLGNSVKFTQDNGSVQVTLYQEALPEDTSRVRTHFLVSDTGIGMSREYQEKLFDSFSREDNAQVQKTEGSGLGMAITKYIVDAMGGTIAVRSELDKGTEFHVTFDLEKAEEKEMDAAEKNEEAADPELKGKHILLAEDNELNWEVAKELLSDLELELDWAENGEICVAQFKKSPVGYYDAVIMDVRMPVMNGYEATRAIRELDREDSDIPVIAMTADAFSEDIQKCLECGMNDHLAKPIDIQAVTRKLKKYLK